MKPAARWVACVSGLAGAMVVLHGLGADLQSGERDGVTVAMSVLRLVALAAGWWLLGLALLDGISRVAGARPLQRLSDRLTPAAFRELLGTGAGAGMASLAALGVVGPPPSLAAAPAPPAGDSSVVMRVVEDEPEPGTATMHVIEEPVEIPLPVPEPAPTPAPGDDKWVVAPGESFWTIAAEQVAGGLGRHPTDAEITGYWSVLIDANRSSLPDPSNPDLLFPGHELTLPAFPRQ